MILPGLTLVVSPLLSLMVDQLMNLPAFLPGGFLASNQVNIMHAYSFMGTLAILILIVILHCQILSDKR